MQRSGNWWKTLVLVAVSSAVILPVAFVAVCAFLSPDSATQLFQNIYSGAGTDSYMVFRNIRFGFDQFLKAFLATPRNWVYFWNSVAIVIPCILGTILVAVLGGYGLAKFSFPGKRILLFFFLIVMMLPYQVRLVPDFYIATAVGLIGTRAGIILPNIFTPFGCYLLFQYISRIPNSSIEAAKVDGANSFQILICVVIPQAWPGIGALALLNLIDLWNSVEPPLIILREAEKLPFSVALREIGSVDISVSFACAIVYMIPVLLAFLVGRSLVMIRFKK